MQLLLEKEEVLEVGKHQRDAQIVCHAGRCWVTISGDSRDYVLHSGNTMMVSGSGSVCIAALGDARVQVITESRLPSWLEKLTSGRFWGLKKRALLQ